MIDNKMLDLEKIKIKDYTNEDIYYGGNQDWFNSKWQRISGCAPTTASNIILYYTKDNKKSMIEDKKNFIKLMETMWNYITPTRQGVYLIDMFIKGYTKYMKEYHDRIAKENFIEITKEISHRPENKKLFEFLISGIKDDHPVAFLNLDNGQEKKLDSYHWVMIMGVTYDSLVDKLSISIVDEGKLKNIDLGLWKETTFKGGGFVYFKNQ